ncbi:MAG: hypothetical protein U1E76_01735 [Planctomycetota bacterium]
MNARRGRRRWWLVVLIAGSAGCQYDLSFKSTTIERATREQAYKASLEVLRDCYYQIPIYPDAATGQIETDYLTKPGNPTYREKVYIKIEPVGDESVRLEVLAPIEQMDMSSPAELKWELLGSDWKVEKALLDRILQRIVAAPLPAEPEPEGPPVAPVVTSQPHGAQG